LSSSRYGVTTMMCCYLDAKKLYAWQSSKEIDTHEAKEVFKINCFAADEVPV